MALKDTFDKNVETMIAGALHMDDAKRWAQPAAPAKAMSQNGER